MVINPMVQSVNNHLKNKSKNSIFDWSKGAVIPISQVSDEMPVLQPTRMRRLELIVF